MGLDGFVEDGWTTSAPPVLRLLLKPSFDPEVCITLTGSPEGARLSVVALTEMLWRQEFPHRLEGHRDEAAVAPDTFEQTERDYSEAFAECSIPGRFVTIDGMGIESCCVSLGQVRRFAGHVTGRPSVDWFVARLIAAAWAVCCAPQVKNGLGRCARYVGVDLPWQQEPPEPRLTRILVLGVPDEREEYIRLLKQRLGLTWSNPAAVGEQ
jgi:hypothetical protein